MERKPVPPPLPPRKPIAKTPLHLDSPPPYEAVNRHNHAPTFHDADHDPRSDSTESLVPTKSNVQHERRKLLCIYVHGFMGDVTSFQSFPAHVHNLLTVLVAETHVVHTKMYPRYRSKKDISFARDDFSRWLAPHESSTTDVVLLGHSMGGLLTAEVVLMSDPSRATLMHRILGSINFDVPFLGMHPGVIRSGLASIFSPAPEPAKAASTPAQSPVVSPMESTAGSIYSTNSNVTSPMSSMLDMTTSAENMDPNFNPVFKNDVNLPVRKGWSNVWHFVNKHSDNLTQATKQLVTSHMEFGGAMANYNALKLRYTRIRALEESNDAVRKSVVGSDATPPRVRFINYYTASTGRPQKPKTPEAVAAVGGSGFEITQSQADLTLRDAEQGKQNSGQENKSNGLNPTTEDHLAVDRKGSRVRSTSPRLSVDEYSDEGVIHKDLENADNEPISEMDHLDPRPVSSQDEACDDESFADAMEDFSTEHKQNVESSQSSMTGTPITPSESTLSLAQSTSTISAIQSLPLIPDAPPKPEPPDLSTYMDADTRKVVEKDYARTLKTYTKTIKDREKAVKDRAKLAEKLDRKSKKDAEKTSKQRSKQKLQQHEDMLKLERRETDREWKEIQRQDQEEQEAKAKANPGIADKHPDEEKELRDGSGVNTTAGEETDGKGKEKEKVQKDRKFCMLPPKDSRGMRDPCWVRIFMKNVDEVGAHCGLFFPSETYEGLVADTAARIEVWLGESMSERVARELEAQG